MLQLFKKKNSNFKKILNNNCLIQKKNYTEKKFLS